MKKHFKAPWSNSLKIITGIVLLLLISALFYTGPVGTAVIIGTILICMALAVRGYSIIDDNILIHRLGWAKKFNLSNLTSIEFSPNATMGSVRTFGIGGFLGYIGYFRNSILGKYRAYATNKDNTVVLDFNGNKIVITPEEPTKFVEAVHSQQSK